jgi:hypothetical protein
MRVNCTVSGSLPRRTSTATVSPGWCKNSTSANAFCWSTDTPSIAVTMSPTANPAASAGPAVETSVT